MTKKSFIWEYIKSRLPLLLLALCIITCAVASMVYGKYVDDKEGDATLNVIAEGNLIITVSDPDTEGKYTITNESTSNIPAYVRVAIVVNWQDADGNLWAVPPVEGTSYRIKCDNCTLLNGYYYYNGVRQPGDVFSVQVEAISEGAKTDYTLHVQILAEGIQSVPKSAAENAWKATFDETETEWETVANQGN